MAQALTRQLDSVFHALSDSTRRAILYDLSKKEKTISQIAKPHKMSLAAVSKHLRVLESANLVFRKKQGCFYIMTLNAKAFKSAEKWLLYYQQFWNLRLDALQNFLEKGKV